MNNIHIVLAENIQKFRKQNGMTQEELANKLGVTYQAISKWENAKSAPDIFFLPQLADVFGCSIDILFSRKTQAEEAPDDDTVKIDSVCSALPWKDDDVIRGVVCHGQKILTVKNKLVDKFTFEVIGDTKGVKSECNVSVTGSVTGGCHAKKSIDIGGSATGGLHCGTSVAIGGGHIGGINCGVSVACGGNIEGGINCGVSVAAVNISSKSISCGRTITASGDIEAETIEIRRGEVSCNTLNCDVLKGNVKVKTNA